MESSVTSDITWKCRTNNNYTSIGNCETRGARS